MSTMYILVAAVVIVVIMGIILGPIFARRKRSDRFHDKFGAEEYDRTVETAGNEKKAQKELNERQKHVESLNIRRFQSKSASVIRLIGPQSRENLSTNPRRRLKRRTT